jgi:hypothetical protein
MKKMEDCEMKNEKISGTRYKFACTNCGKTIEPGEKMLTLSASLETPLSDGTLECLDNSAISQVCSHCSSMLSSSLDVSISSSETENGKATLDVHCSERGVVFDLRCSDGISWAPSPLYTWEQIFQMHIAMDPNMFGDLSEPLHHVFPENLELLGYCIPNWRENSKETQKAS